SRRDAVRTAAVTASTSSASMSGALSCTAPVWGCRDSFAMTGSRAPSEPAGTRPRLAKLREVRVHPRDTHDLDDGGAGPGQAEPAARHPGVRGHPDQRAQ